jgi:hypothetical protein
VIRLLVALLVVLAAGCAGPLDASVRTVNAAQPVLAGAHEALRETHERAAKRAVDVARTEAQARCLAERVHASFDPAWDAYAAARLAWLSAHAAVIAAQATEAARAAPDFARVYAAVARSASAWTKLQEAVDAARAFDPATAPSCAEVR